MFLKFNCFAENNTEEIEICTFYGLRFNKIGFAVLYTEHKKHDYLIPMDSEIYNKFLKSVEKMIDSDVKIAYLKGAHVYRMAKGSFFNVKDTEVVSCELIPVHYAE